MVYILCNFTIKTQILHKEHKLDLAAKFEIQPLNMILNLQCLMKVIVIFACIPVKYSESRSFVGWFCTEGGTNNEPGICTPTQDCPTVLSNYRAGISPSLCYMEV